MNELSKKNLENTMNDCLDRASVCPADSEDYLKLIKQAEEIGKLLNAESKIESERKIQTDWHNPRLWIEVAVPIAGSFILAMYQGHLLKVQTMNICQFEKDYTFTTYAGKSLGGYFRELLPGRKRV